MAKKRRRASGELDPTKIARWAGLILIGFGVFMTAALLTFDSGAYTTAWMERGSVLPMSGALVDFLDAQGPWKTGLLAPLFPNAAGGLGVFAAAFALAVLGWIGVWLIPMLTLGWGWNRLLVRPGMPLVWKSLVALPLTACAVAILAAVLDHPAWSGRAGDALWSVVGGAVGPVGGGLFLGVAGIGFFFLEAEAFGGRGGRWLTAIAERLGAAASILAEHGLAWLLVGLKALARALRWSAVALWRALTAVVGWVRSRPWESGVSVDGGYEDGYAPIEDAPQADAPEAHPEEQPEQDGPPRIIDPDRPQPGAAAAPAPQPIRGVAEPNAPGPVPVVPRRPAPANGNAKVAASGEDDAVVVRRVGEGITGEEDVEAAVLAARRNAKQGRVSHSLGRALAGKYDIPRTGILDDVPETGAPVKEAELIENSKILTQTLKDFGITGRVGEVHPGPVITRYEYVPGPGVRVSQILNRQDDLALKLRATRIRILAPIPGKAAVGIEVPNRHPSPIFLRRLLENDAFTKCDGPLPLALGKDIGGNPVVTELSKMPHLLIAGTTGSGKSVCMNALISSLLLRRDPRELRMLMIDPKMLELPMYNGIPHLLTEVVTDPKLAARSLKWALLEMERRYKILAKRGCRNLDSYNRKMETEGPRDEDEEKLPYIVVLIDELADLMITSGKEVEEPIGRLAQTARAVGIHLIVATQRPSVDVITGVLKANFPTRIAFQVASRTDSRTILDQNGAESLLGKGDMLFLPPGQATPLRVHGAYVSEEETQRLAEAWRRQGEPAQYQGLEEAMAEPETAKGGFGEDELFEDAARTVVAAGQASASLLQRRLKVGYARAARLVDMLESVGVVSPQDGSKAREVLVDDVRLEHVLASMDE